MFGAGLYKTIAPFFHVHPGTGSTAYFYGTEHSIGAYMIWGGSGAF